tara:strand:- start:1347 stop:2486 length:1140 start_codon:yes stop_codon:yes gene_type:complete
MATNPPNNLIWKSKMSKIVKAYALDEATNTLLVNQPMVDVELSDAVTHLVSQGAMTDDEGVFFMRQLEHIQAQSYDVLYPELKGRGLFALNTEGGEGIQTITYRSYDKRGETAIIAGKATDLPRGDISGKEYSISVRTLGNAFGYSRQEIASAKLTGMPLEARKAEATRKSYEEKVNQIIFFGSAANNLHGFFDGPTGAPALTCTRTSVAASAASASNFGWADKTPDEIIADLSTATTKMYADTLQLFRPDKIIMSVSSKKILQNTPRSVHSDTSILNWFIANNEFINSADQIVDINEVAGIYPVRTSLSTAFDATGGSSEGFTVVSSGEDNMRVREPFPYMHLPVQLKGLEFEINCYGRFAGLEMVRPAAVQHWMGIA